MYGGKTIKMAVKLMLLKTGETLITDAKEVVQEEQVRGYLFTKPHYVKTQEKMFLWRAILVRVITSWMFFLVPG